MKILKRLDEERRCGKQDGTVVEYLPAITRVDSPYRAIAFSSLSARSADAAILEQVEHHRKLGASFEWKLYAHDTPTDMLVRLERHGFQAGPREAVLVFDLSESPQWIEGADSWPVVRVETLAQVETYQSVSEGLFEKHHEATTAELRNAVRTGSTHVRGYIAYDGSQPVGIGRLYTQPGSIFGGLYGGGTLPGFRGRGFYRALVAARARDAIAGGATHLLVDALPTSRPILHRLGFQWLTDTWPCEWHPAKPLASSHASE